MLCYGILFLMTDLLESRILLKLSLIKTYLIKRPKPLDEKTNDLRDAFIGKAGL